MHFLRALTAAFLLMSTALLCACATAPCSEAVCRDDRALQSEVEQLLAQHPDLGPPNIISVQVHNGIVYLHGLVATDLQKQDAEAVIRQSPRVKQVENMIGLDNSTY